MVNKRLTQSRRPAANPLARMTGRAASVMITALLVALLAGLGWYLDQRRPSLSGHVRVIDGDSLVIDGTEIRLYGIDAPEYRQTCQRGGEAWSCGIEARRALQAMVSGRTVTCRPRDEDRYGRLIASCEAAGNDLGATMIKGGHAVSLGAYDVDEREARAARRGVWSSNFERPAAWRARHPRPNRDR